MEAGKIYKLKENNKFKVVCLKTPNKGTQLFSCIVICSNSFQYKVGLIDDTFVQVAFEEDKTYTQIGGTHYSIKSIQPIEYIVANKLNFCEGNVIKYVTRYKDKNGVEDLKKAMHYLEFLIAQYENKESI